MDMKITLLRRGEIVFQRRNDNHNMMMGIACLWKEILEETLVSLVICTEIIE